MQVDNAFRDLDPDKRIILVELLTVRAEYQQHQAELTRLRALAISDPSEENARAVEDYSATYLKPLRDLMQAPTLILLQEAVNVEGLNTMIPMLLMGLLQYVDPSLLFATLGIDSDMASEVIGLARDYFSN